MVVQGSAEFIRQAQDEQFASAIDAVLERGWCADFEAAHAQLVVFLKAYRDRLEHRALCRALLSLTSAALGDIGAARTRARQVIHDTARPGGWTGAGPLCVLRRARALAVRSSVLIGDHVRGRRAAQARFVARDPDSRWLMTADGDSAWEDAPNSVRGFARFLGAVLRAYAKHPVRGILSPTEVAILQSVQDGRSAPQVAQQLGRSSHTVRTHLRNAYAKLGASGRADALIKARELGLLQV